MGCASMAKKDGTTELLLPGFVVPPPPLSCLKCKRTFVGEGNLQQHTIACTGSQRIDGKSPGEPDLRVHNRGASQRKSYEHLLLTF